MFLQWLSGGINCSNTGTSELSGLRKKELDHGNFQR